MANLKVKKHKSPAWTRKEGQNPEGGLNDKEELLLKQRAVTLKHQ